MHSVTLLNQMHPHGLGNHARIVDLLWPCLGVYCQLTGLLLCLLWLPPGVELSGHLRQEAVHLSHPWEILA